MFPLNFSLLLAAHAIFRIEIFVVDVELQIGYPTWKSNVMSSRLAFHWKQMKKTEIDTQSYPCYKHSTWNAGMHLIDWLKMCQETFYWSCN